VPGAAVDCAIPEPQRYVEPKSPIPRSSPGRVARWYRRGPGAWDLFAGAIAPAVLIAIDRPVCGLHHESEGVLPGRPYSAIAALCSIVALLAWWRTHDRPRSFHGYLAGALATGALLSFGLAVLLTPLALIGLLILIGILGFFPWVTCATFVRATLRAFASARATSEAPERRFVVAKALVGAAAVVGIVAFGGNAAIHATHTATHVALGEVPGDRAAAVNTLRRLYVFPQVELDRHRLLSADSAESTDPKASLWSDITGNDGSSMDDW
jgi:hypothetical protein